MPVPSAPKIANSGQSTPRMRRLGRIVNASASVRVFTRSAITEMCAIVNDSIAPNAYMFPRKSAWPGISVRQAIPPNTMIPIHGVRKRGCS